jgi:hypothetical protein
MIPCPLTVSIEIMLKEDGNVSLLSEKNIFHLGHSITPKPKEVHRKYITMKKIIVYTSGAK